MKIFVVKGKTRTPLTPELFKEFTSLYTQSVLDVGAGDGKGSLRYARNNPNTLVIALDSNPDSLITTSRKALCKPERGGADNLICIYANIIDSTEILADCSDLTRIILPWGDLLEGIANIDSTLITSLCSCTHIGGSIEIIINGEIWKNNLPQHLFDLGEITPEFFTKQNQIFRQYGLSINDAYVMSKEEIRNLETTWSAKLMSSRTMACFIKATGVVTQNSFPDG